MHSPVNCVFIIQLHDIAFFTIFSPWLIWPNFILQAVFREDRLRRDIEDLQKRYQVGLSFVVFL